MSQRNCALEWPEDGPPKKATHPPIERFKNGAKKTLILLGDPVKRGIHWNAEQKCSVPCFRPAYCPFCNEPKFVNTAREEGFAPALILNEQARQWQQVVAVFTKGGLNSLAAVKPEDYRGCMIEVQKVGRVGATSPMHVKMLPPLPENFPALPPAFSVKAIMLRVWFPTIDHAEPIEWIEPIKVERRRPPQENSVQPMELDAEEAVLLAAKLKAAGFSNLANHVKQRPADQAPTSPAATAATSPPAAPAARSKPPVTAPDVAPRASRPGVRIDPPAQDPTAEPDLLGDTVDGVVERIAPELRITDGTLTVEGDTDRQLFGRPVQRGPKVAVYKPLTPEEEEEALTKHTGSIVCGDYKDKPFLKNGTHHANGTGKGGAK